MYKVEIESNNDILSTESETIEGIKVWMRVVCPVAVSDTEFAKIQMGEKLIKTIIIEKIVENVTPPPDETV